MNFQPFHYKKLKKYSRTALLSSSTLLLAGCLDSSNKSAPATGLEATGGNDVMVGDGQANTFVGSLGSDSMDGGGGIDLVDYVGSTTAVQVNFLTGVGTGGQAKGDTYTSIEAIRGSVFGDILTGSGKNELFIGYSGADIIDGGGGTDTIEFSGSFEGVAVNLVTGSGSGGDAEGDVYSNIENIIGSDFGDILVGDADDNKIDGELGDDIIIGGAGDDILSGNGSDIISGGKGIDTLVLDYTPPSGASNVNAISKYEILKDDNKIAVNAIHVDTSLNFFSGQIDSIELLLVSKTGIFGDYNETIDVKSIWDDLIDTEHSKFNNNESEFLTWLGDDAGYNYSGL